MRVMKGLSAIGLALLAFSAVTQDQPPPTPQQRVAMLKQWLQASQAQLRSYEWIETTVVSKDGVEKTRTAKRCYYGVDGALQKVATSTSSADSSGGPPGVLIPGKIIKRVGARKKENLEEYMKSAGELVHGYVPPDPARIQQTVDAGKFSLQIVKPGLVGRLVFSDYLKAGDALSVVVELPTNRLMAVRVASYVEAADDAVTLDVAMGVLPDGTIFTQRTTLEAKSKGVTVVVENSGHRRTSGS